MTSPFIFSPSVDPSGYKGCAPERKVVFLKTHKCASSTLQNMLFRFARQNELNVVLPLTGNYLGKEIAFHPSMIANTPWERAGLDYDMYGLHGIWEERFTSVLFFGMKISGMSYILLTWNFLLTITFKMPQRSDLT